MLWRWQAGTIIQKSVFICKAYNNGGGGDGGGSSVFNKRKCCPRENLQYKIWVAEGLLFMTRRDSKKQMSKHKQ